jgi:hypothetical protein
MKTTTKYLEIMEAKYVSGYKLRLSFNDGAERIMDFESFLRHAQNPDLTQYRQLRKFKNFRLHYGNLMWGDYEMIFPIMDLYRGNLLKGEESAPAHFVLSDAVSPTKTVSEKKVKPVAVVSYRKRKS